MSEAAEAGATKRQHARDRLLAMHGELSPGAVIPPERVLAENLGVSRPTLRAAVDQLVAEGYLERRHGSGTYVTHPKVAMALTLTSFSEDMRRRGLEPGGRVLSFHARFAGAELCHRLDVSPRAQVWSIRRLRTADDDPMAIEQAYLPHSLFPDLTAASLTNASLYTLLDEVGVRIGVATQSVEPTVTTEEESELLGVPVLSPAFLFERLTLDRNDSPIEFVRSIYRGDRYRLLAELRPPFA
ncbi:GntR family transcriptional regulator [Aeromicrobium sp. CTD01-1L150]|uniref:GntR family transcriptional regulator n=1 Tax=Aeromicrobium sp. CTD01-1L150 TaxID=3341830 RepID=UPI0035C14C2A